MVLSTLFASIALAGCGGSGGDSGSGGGSQPTSNVVFDISQEDSGVLGYGDSTTFDVTLNTESNSVLAVDGVAQSVSFNAQKTINDIMSKNGIKSSLYTVGSNYGSKISLGNSCQIIVKRTNEPESGTSFFHDDSSISINSYTNKYSFSIQLLNDEHVVSNGAGLAFYGDLKYQILSDGQTAFSQKDIISNPDLGCNINTENNVVNIKNPEKTLPLCAVKFSNALKANLTISYKLHNGTEENQKFTIDNGKIISKA